MFDFADRVKNLPPYGLARTEPLKEEARRKGLDLIDLTIGSPDLRPPQAVLDALKEALEDPKISYHRYSPFKGLPEFRQAVATWYERRFGVLLDPEKEILPVVGSKEGLEKVAMALLNKGDTALIPSPAYPAYLGAVHLVEGAPYEMPLLEKNAFVPDLETIPSDVARRARYMLFNYPNNPTGATESDFYERALAFCRRNDVLCISDIAYSELGLDPGVAGRSIFQLAGAKEIAIEFQSFSKMYSMAGWRVGFVAGRADVIEALMRIKTNCDFSVWPAVQRAAAKILTGPQDCVDFYRGKYRERRDAALAGLARIGWSAHRPKAGMYVWIRMPQGYGSSTEFVRDVLLRSGVAMTPGIGFGRYGEGYVRIALVEDKAKIEEAFRRIEAGVGAAAPEK
jgi:LL-diaminopimelate aminotransferase